MLALNDEGDGIRPVADINVTPFIDVVLVLLIIFMVAAPLALAEVPLKLPSSTAAPAHPPRTPVVVSLNREGRLFLDEEELAETSLGARLAQLLAEDPERVIHLRADRELPYGEVTALLGKLGAQGASRLSLLTEQAGP